MSRTKKKTPKKSPRPLAAAEQLVHTKLTVKDIDAINLCHLRLLNAAVLLELGLLHHDDEEIGGDADAHLVPDALLDIVERLREDVTMIGVTIDQAGDRDEAGKLRACGARAAASIDATRRAELAR